MSAVTIGYQVSDPRLRVSTRRCAVAAPQPQRSSLAADASQGLRITRRGRLVLTGAATALLAVGGLVGAGQALAGSQSSPAPEPRSVVVVPGDTLWDIAAAHAAPGEDVRDVIVEIRQANELSTSSVKAGQTLIVPGE